MDTVGLSLPDVLAMAVSRLTQLCPGFSQARGELVEPPNRACLREFRRQHTMPTGSNTCSAGLLHDVCEDGLCCWAATDVAQAHKEYSLFPCSRLHALSGVVFARFHSWSCAQTQG